MKKRVYIYGFVFFFIDLLSKQIIKNMLSLYESIQVIPNFFHLTYVINDGAAFSILEGKQWLFIILGIFLLFLLFYYLQKEKLNSYKVFYYSLLLGGVTGNLFDRIVYHGVIDFFDFRIFSYHAPIFNLADIFIVISIFLLLFQDIKEEIKK